MVMLFVLVLISMVLLFLRSAPTALGRFGQAHTSLSEISHLALTFGQVSRRTA